MHGGGADENHGGDEDDAAGDEALAAAGVVPDLAVGVEGTLDADEEEGEADEAKKRPATMPQDCWKTRFWGMWKPRMVGGWRCCRRRRSRVASKERVESRE